MALQRRNQFEKNITRLRDACPDDQIQTMDRTKTEDSIAKLQRNFDNFEREHLQLVGEAKTANEITPLDEKYDEIDDMCTTLRLKLTARQHEINRAEAQAQRPTQTDDTTKQTIEVNLKSANLMSNITDTWGPFHGDYDKWPDFREKFKANVHVNDVLTPVQKCQLLIKACKGAAFATIGGKTLAATEANYVRAWKRLHEVYTDDYLAVQQTVKQLLTTTVMQEPNHDQIRRMLDMIHDVEGKLSNFFDVESWHPIIMFTCLFRLDADTYEKWETERQASAFRQQKPNQPQADAMEEDRNDQPLVEVDENAVQKPNIPSLEKFKQFLETQCRVLVHKMGQMNSAQNSNQSRSRDSSSNRSKPSQQTGAIPKTKPKSNDQQGARQPKRKLPPCRLCNEDHGMFKCDIFKSMPFDDRVELVRKHHLCEVCYHVHNPGDCYVTQRPCDKCPGEIYHNTQLCPTREADRRTSTLMSVVGNAPEPITFSKPNNKRRNDRRE